MNRKAPALADHTVAAPPFGSANARPPGARYALGAFATGTFGTVPGLLLLYYLTDALAVPASVASVVLVVPKVWDVLLHPWVGRRSDRTTGRFGPRMPWMACGGVVLSAGFALMFTAPTPDGLPSALWVGGLFFLCASAYAAFQVPYAAVLAELSDQPAQRRRLATWRTVCYGCAILLSGGAGPLIVNAPDDRRLGYALMGAALGAVLLLGTLAAALTAPRTAAAASDLTLRQQLAVVRDSRPFRLLLGTHIGQTLATGIMLAAAQYFATYRLHDPAATTRLFACLILPLLLSAPLWQWAARHIGPRRGLLAAICLFIAGSLLLVETPRIPHLGVYALVALCGIGYAGLQVLAVALLSDTIAEDALRHGGRSRGGAFAGLWTAGEVLGAGLGPALFSGILAATGFVSSSPGHHVTQPASALTAIILSVSVLPALALLPAVVCAVRLMNHRA